MKAEEGTKKTKLQLKVEKKGKCLNVNSNPKLKM